MALAVVLLSAFSAQAATEIQWWHAMGGKLGQKVEEICKNFNASQSGYKVKPVYKGNYTETMTSAIAAFRAKKQPQIVQVFEVGTASMMAAKGAIYPVYKLMADMGESFDQSAYLQAVIGYYTTPEGNMLSMPFNSSTPVLYYNKTAFQKSRSGPKPAPQNLARTGRGRQEDHRGRRGQIRLQRGLAVLGAFGELLGLAQCADRQQGQRLCRHRHQL